jgi:hypothetical protein
VIGKDQFGHRGIVRKQMDVGSQDPEGSIFQGIKEFSGADAGDQGDQHQPEGHHGQHDAAAQGFVNGMLRSFVRNGKKISYRGLEAADRLSVEYSCPKWLAEKWIAEYDINNTVKALKASVGRPPVYARVNTLKTNTEDLLEALKKEKIAAKKYSGLDDCIILEKTGDIEKSKAFRAGLSETLVFFDFLCYDGIYESGWRSAVAAERVTKRDG